MSISIAFSSHVLAAYAGLPKPQQKKFSDMLNRFRNNPKSPGINYEHIKGASSPALRSLRIDRAYRAIVRHPEKGNQYIFLWLGHHDRAYEWAHRKKVSIHPDTGAIQIFEAINADETSVPRKTKSEPNTLFNALRDRQLRRLGVPSELISVVRGIKDKADLDRCEPSLPRDAFEALYYISEEVPYEEVLRSIEPEEEEIIETDDFDKALSRANSKRQFVVVENDSILEEMLDASLEQWRVFLHPSQRRLVEMHANGPVRVLGGAGTGKTVVAMHRAKRLAEEVFNEKTDRILFTTFTRNLAGDIKTHLQSITSPEHMQRIEVVNFDRWVAKLMHQMGVQYRIAYGGRENDIMNEAWDEALDDDLDDLGYSEQFYEEEFRHVILANGITSEREYYRVARVGRGQPLKRPVRKRIWPVFARFRSYLSARKLRMPEDAYRDLRALLKERIRALPYRAVIVDEAQDMGAEAMRLIRQVIPEKSPNDLFIVGDAHQRIYGRKVVLGRCGIDIRGRGRWLRINYRTPEEIRDWAVRLLYGINIDDLDGERDTITLKQYVSLIRGSAPDIRSFDDFGDETRAIADYIRTLVPFDRWQRICVVARTNSQRSLYEGALKSRGIQTHPISRHRPDNRAKQGVRLATMHRVKGLEFDHVIAAGVNHDKLPLAARLDNLDDQGLRQSATVMERSLLFVTATRAKKSLLITCHGKPSPFIRPCPATS